MTLGMGINLWGIRAPQGGDPNVDSVVLLPDFGATDAGTSFTDLSTSGNTITPAGNAQADTDVVKFTRSSLLLDGTGDYTSTPASADFDFGAGDFTVEGWVYFNTVGNTGLVSKWSATAAEQQWRVNWGSNLFFFNWVTSAGSSANISVSTGALTAGTWYFFAASRVGTRIRIHWNGTAENSTTVNPTIRDGTVAPLYLGVINPGNNDGDIRLSNIRVTKGVGRYPDAAIVLPTEDFPAS